MFCTNCGRENQPGTVFCTGCGQNFQGNAAVQSTQYSIYAGFWKRLAAYLIDGLLLGVVIGIPVYIITTLIMAGFMPDFASMQSQAAQNNFASSDMIQNDAAIQSLILQSVMKAMIINLALSSIGIVISWLYFTLMESSSKQATLGKMALGIIVTDLDGNRISFRKATGRYFGKILSGMIMYIGFVMVAFTEKRQALHDILAKTLVVNK